METLHLNLIKKWFEKVVEEEKPVEYRALTYYWANRFFDIPKNKKREIKEMFEAVPCTTAWHCYHCFPLKPFKTITFSNGMKSPEFLPRFEIKFKSLDISEGQKEWGAKDGEVYFCLHLGDVLHKQNC